MDRVHGNQRLIMTALSLDSAKARGTRHSKIKSPSMAYRFKLSEAFDDGVRRIGLQQIDRAIARLEVLDDEVTSVHETRKGMKRVRALLRLSRPGLSEETFAAENGCFRDIGRLLAAPRDRHVMIETAGKLEELAVGRAKTAVAAVRTKLGAANGGEAAPADKRVIAQALFELRGARQRMDDLKLRATSFEVAFDGVRQTYKQGVRAFEAASGRDASAGDLHEWRKKVQHHWRHMMLLSLAWPEIFAARVATARELSAALGEDNDIAMLQAALTGDGAFEVTAAQRAAIEAVGGERRTALRLQAQALGRLLFAEKASAFRERIRQYWTSAQESTVSRAD